MFWLALHGYVGAELAIGAKQARKVRIHDDVIKSFGGVPLRTLIMFFIFTVMVAGWSKFFFIFYLALILILFLFCSHSRKNILNIANIQTNRSCLDLSYVRVHVGYFVYGQASGQFFHLKYPKCFIPVHDIVKLNNGICDGGDLNTIACGFDDGDCVTFNMGYPNCKIEGKFKV